MKHLLLVAALICCAIPAIAEDRLAIGTIMTLPTGHHHSLYGCNDVENTKEIERLRAQSNTFVDHYMGDRAVNQFVRDHNVSLSSHKPEYFSDVCVELPTKIKWKVVRTDDWADGGPQLVCVAPMETFDVAQQAGASSTPRDEPSCWWTVIHNK